MIYRLKEIKHIRYNGEQVSEWYIQYKFTYWPFWFTEQENGYAGSWDRSFDSKESAETYLAQLIVRSEKRIVHTSSKYHKIHTPETHYLGL